MRTSTTKLYLLNFIDEDRLKALQALSASGSVGIQDFKGAVSGFFGPGMGSLQDVFGADGQLTNDELGLMWSANEEFGGANKVVDTDEEFASFLHDIYERVEEKGGEQAAKKWLASLGDRNVWANGEWFPDDVETLVAYLMQKNQKLEAQRNVERSKALRSRSIGSTGTHTPGFVDPNAAGRASGGSTIDPSKGIQGGPLNQIQHDSMACGQASSAMFISKVTGKPFSSAQFEAKHGFSLRGGMAAETGATIDDTNVDPSTENLLIMAAQGSGAVLGLSSPYGSPHGHIYYVKGYNESTGKFTLANPADGKDIEVTFEQILADGGHSDGKFLHYNVADVSGGGQNRDIARK